MYLRIPCAIAIILIGSCAAVDVTGFCFGYPTDQFSVPEGDKADSFHMVVIGDSVAWGEGLLRNEKYYYQLADWLNKTLGRTVEVTVYAHNGAKLDSSADEDYWDDTYCRDAECGSDHPSLLKQIDFIEDPDNVDLVLVSGGINDVGIFSIMDSDVTRSKLEDDTAQIKDLMLKVLHKLHKKCSNANIVVTGYYGIVSSLTDYTWVIPENSPISFLNGYRYFRNVYPELYKMQHDGRALTDDYLTYTSKLLDNCILFQVQSDEYLKDAVSECTGESRILFIPLNFQAENSLGAPKTLLWGFDFSIWEQCKLTARGIPNLIFGKQTIPKMEDHNYDYRVERCRMYHDENDDKAIQIDELAALAHPNVEGASRYYLCIKNGILQSWSDWLNVKEIHSPTNVFADSTPSATQNACSTTEADSWLEKGDAQDNYQGAIECYDMAITICPQYAKAWCAKAGPLVDLGRYDEALQACDKAIELDPNLAEAWATKGGALYSLKRSTESLQACEKAIELDSQSAYAWSCKGVIFTNLQRFDEALIATENAVNFNSKPFKRIWYNYGVALYYSKRYDEAIQAFDKEIEINPNWANAWQVKGLALKKCNRGTEAKIAFKRAAELGYNDMFSFYYMMS